MKIYFKRVLIIIPIIVFIRSFEKLNDDEKLSERQLQNKNVQKISNEWILSIRPKMLIYPRLER